MERITSGWLNALKNNSAPMRTGLSSVNEGAMPDLEAAINDIIKRHTTDRGRLQPLADYLIDRFAERGLAGLTGGSLKELNVPGFARNKDWDVGYDFAGKPRLLVSLKSIWRKPGGTVPNRLDDLMGEASNAQQMSPEVVIGYVMLFDNSVDTIRKRDGLSWSQFLEARLKRISIRKAPLWNQGLIEDSWLIRFDSRNAEGHRIMDLPATAAAGDAFIDGLLSELHIREPAIQINSPHHP